MTIDEIQEKKEDLEHEIQRQLMVFEKDTKVKINSVQLEVLEINTLGEMDADRDIQVKLEVRL